MENSEKKALPIIALIIGILALVLSWVPIVNNFAAVLAIIGIILGVIALVLNRKNKKTLSIVGTIISVIAMIVVLVTQSMYSNAIDKAIGKTETSSSVTKSNGKATDKTEAKSDSKWDETTKTFTSSDGVLKIDGVEKTSDYDGKPSIKINFTLTNKKEKAENVQTLIMSMMKVQQKTANTTNNLEYAILMDDSENHLQDNLNPNGTVSGNYSYVLDTETDPVQIHFMENMFSDPVATYEVAI
ncbi:DUF5067 domain-containing protein [Lactococcus garvieae]|uniref:DUF5067 domain-containing protein n=1 Tax=Lactococcus TaxID=1357 RepID=UPI0013FE18D8|nr:DUF5067 domain-containing protein [Lactococcus garvieae]NHI68972.1 DUF5067 domain-containing protein [Lactococcus garvieae]NHJ07530.1 DUF5067 domain-containing protein [Lactococcus garvieae]